MLYILLLAVSVLIGGYFIFRYFSLVCALNKLVQDINDIQQDLSRNQMLHLPIPDRHLGRLLCAFNAALENIQKERQTYEKREKEFQKQIENISHDLRTPLTVILGYLKLFRRSCDPRSISYEDLDETLSTVEHKAEAMLHLVDAFYDYSRLNAGRYADSWLKITINEESEKTVISFFNDTRKLSGEDTSHLFERFYMQDDSRHQSGTGLGLTVARALAEEMNGMLRVNAEEWDKTDKDVVDDACGAGALTVCFELYLPSC